MKEKHSGKLIHRTVLFTAGHNEKYLQKTFSTDADAIVFDLEDAVPYNKKDEARKILKEFLSKPLPDNRPVYVRINPLNSGDTLLDLDATICPNINGFLYPMTNSAQDVIIFAAQLSLKEKQLNLPNGYFDIITVIETPAGVLNIQEIATSSKRVIGLLFGSEDFLAEQEGNHGENSEGINVPRHLISMAARAANIMAIDTPYVNVGDFEGLKKHIKKAKNLGYNGMVVMSPRELPIIKELYTPNERELEYANKIVKLSEAAVKENRGIVISDGVFVSPPTLKASKKTISRINAIRDYENFINNSKK
jgi:citrate lyase subunit beta/citryl-CoA lyase